MTFAEQLRAARAATGISQSQAALAIGRSVRTLQAWEQGRNVPHPTIQAAAIAGFWLGWHCTEARPERGVIFRPSVERGCKGKANLGRKYVKQAERMSAKHGKRYGVYRCPHCRGAHLTTKIENAEQYFAPLLYVCGPNDKAEALSLSEVDPPAAG